MYFTFTLMIMVPYWFRFSNLEVQDLRESTFCLLLPVLLVLNYILVFGGILDNANSLGFASYGKRTHDGRGLQLTKENYGQHFSNVANKYRNLLNNDQTYNELNIDLSWNFQLEKLNSVIRGSTFEWPTWLDTCSIKSDPLTVVPKLSAVN